MDVHSMQESTILAVISMLGGLIAQMTIQCEHEAALTVENDMT